MTDEAEGDNRNHRNFTREYLVDVLNLPDDAVFSQIVGSRRWTQIVKIVFEDDGKFWQTNYEVGSTENQEVEPWEYEATVDAIEVQLEEVLVKKWLPVFVPGPITPA